MPTYERTMEIEFTSDEWSSSDKNAERVASYLHERGIHMVSSYFWGDAETANDDDNYGYVEHEDSTTNYQVTIDDREAFVIDYRSEAIRAVDGLIENGYVADWTELTEIKRYMGWKKWRGEYMMHSWECEGLSRSSGYPHIRYLDDGGIMTVQLRIRLVPSYNKWTLTFRITHDIEGKGVDRKKVEDRIVQIPANDMRNVRSIVQECLELISDAPVEFNVNCSTKILSSANYDCSPETVSLIMSDEEEE